MTEEVGKKVCEGTVADLMKDKTGKQTVVTLTRKNASKRQTEKQNCIRLNLKNGKPWNSCIPVIWKTCLMLHTMRTGGVPSNLKQGRKQTSCNMKNNL